MHKHAYIDSLRGLAILLVVMVHTSQAGSLDVSPAMKAVLGEGARGVQLFFLVSACTLFASLQSRSVKEKFPVQNFYIRRLFRVAPLYFLAFCYYLWQDGTASQYWMEGRIDITPGNIAGNALFLHTFNPWWIKGTVPGSWSIGMEMLFYLLLPLLFMRIRNVNQAIVFFGAALLLRMALHEWLIRNPLIEFKSLWEEYLLLYFPSQLPVFALGIVVYFMIREPQKMIQPALILGLGSVCIALIQIASGKMFLLPNHLLFSLGFATLFVFLSQLPFFLLVNPVLVFTGKLSYTLYIVHFAMLHWMGKWGLLEFTENGILNYFIRYGVVLVLSFAVAVPVYYLFEEPVKKLGAAWIARRETA